VIVLSNVCCSVYVDKLDTGFIVWSKRLKAYRPPPAVGPVFNWELASQSALKAIRATIGQDGWFDKLVALYAQESNRTSGSSDLRPDNMTFIKSLSAFVVISVFFYVDTAQSRCSRVNTLRRC
jgi:proteasome activator subunit 4